MVHGKSNQAFRFLGGFLRNPARTGSILPSSRALARAMMKDIDIRRGERVVELGPGTGAFTAEIRGRLGDARRYVGIECYPAFVECLERRFPDLRFISGRAEQVLGGLRAEAGAPIRTVISGLPFVTLRREMQEAIIACLDQVMVPGAVFRTFQYAHTYFWPSAVRFRHRMTDTFGPHERGRVVLENLPPAVVLTWTRANENGGSRKPNGTPRAAHTR